MYLLLNNFISEQIKKRKKNRQFCFSILLKLSLKIVLLAIVIVTILICENAKTNAHSIQIENNAPFHLCLGKKGDKKTLLHISTWSNVVMR